MEQKEKQNHGYEFVLTIVVGVLLAATALADDTSSILRAMKGKIQRAGAKAVIMELYDDNYTASWRVLMEAIRSLDITGLEVANSLLESADGATMEELSVAIGQAIDQDPVKVFQIMPKLADHDFQFLEFACAMTPEELVDNEAGKVELYKKRSLKLKSLLLPSWQPFKERCLKVISSAMENSRLACASGDC